MKNVKATVTRNLEELVGALGLTPADGVKMEVRSEINDKIISIVTRSGLTHAQVAKLAKTSRSRITAILNRNTKDVSADLMLRILANLGYRARVSFAKVAAAA